jgi:methyltransferase (TIGR00027 family)
MKDDQPSVTALFIAHAILVLGCDAYGRSHLPPGCLQVQRDLLLAAGLPFDDHSAHQTVLRAASVPVWLQRRHILWRRSDPLNLRAKLVRLLTNRYYQRDLLIGIGFRKCWLQDQVTHALLPVASVSSSSSSPNDSQIMRIRQVLVVGAGYDTLAYRLANEHSDVDFWEVDHPATAKVKQKALDAMIIQQQQSCSTRAANNNMHTLRADLTRTNLSEEFAAQPNYNPDRPTLVIMEGLLYYLTEQDVKALFADIAKMVGAGSIVAFNFCEWSAANQCPDIGGGRKNNQTRILERLAKVGEPMRWGVAPEDLGEFFRGTSWEVMAVTPMAALGRERLAKVKLLTVP